MHMRTLGKIAVAAVVCLSVAACSTGRTADTRRGVSGAASIPLRDVGLMRPEIPLLLRNLQYPYATASLTDCNAVTREISQLDGVLGPESYQPARTATSGTAAAVEDQAIQAAENTAEDLIPFRSWVRRISSQPR